MSLGLYETIVNYLREKRSGVLATIVRRVGSAPRQEGSFMFIGEDLKSFGTIGGGVLEAETLAKAQTVMRTKMPILFHYRMDARSVEEEGMLCGGNVDVLLEPVLPEQITMYEEVFSSAKKRERGIFYVRFLNNSFSKSFLKTDGLIFGDPLHEEEIKIIQDYGDLKAPIILDEKRILIPILIKSVLYIFGAGHVSRYLAMFANYVDFSVTVIDESEDFANRENFPEAENLIVSSFEDSFKNLDFTGEEYVVIVTRGHKSDTFCLREVLKRPFAYVGMIGSKRKIQTVFEYLRNEGVPDYLLERVHAPIGIDINSETPQEVAISIVAELIKERGEKIKNARRGN